MIVLTAYYRNEKKRYLFNQEKILISTSKELPVDLVLEGISFSMRFSIEKRGELYEIHNIDNDPFLSLNGRPFHKKQIFNQDFIEVDTLKIDFSLEESGSFTPVVEEKTAKELAHPLKPREDQTEVPDSTLPPATSEKRPSPFSQAAVDAQKLSPLSHKVPLALRLILSFALLLIGISSSIALGVYRHYEEKSVMDAKNAARGIADIALALVYAQLHHIQPPQQNWSDPSFLNRGINGIISPFHAQLHHVDIRGKLLLSNYFLRIYTSKDLNRFLVIAQPEPSISQWLFSEQSIVLDSDTMMIKKLSDLRALNRLLVNPDSLTELSGERVSEILYTGDLVSLTSLSDEKNANGFAPPEELTSIAPQAAYYIYNAPRYSKVGEALLSDASLLASSQKKDPASLKKLVERIEQLSLFPYAVLYTTYGKEQAQEAQKALKELFADKAFLIGFTRYDYQKQSTTSTLLPPLYEEEIALVPPVENVEETDFLPSDKISSEEAIISLDPLKEELESQVDETLLQFSEEREQKLKALAAPIIALLNRHQKESISKIEQELPFLVQNYLQGTQEMDGTQDQEIALMQEQESCATELLPSIQALEPEEPAVEADAEEDIIEQTQSFLPNSSASLEELVEAIDGCKNIKQLFRVVNLCSKTYALCNFCDIDHIIRCQRTIRQHVLCKITSFLQDEKDHLLLEELSDIDRKHLEEIIRKSWVYDPVERRYYLNEFDELKKELSFEKF